VRALLSPSSEGIAIGSSHIAQVISVRPRRFEATPNTLYRRGPHSSFYLGEDPGINVVQLVACTDIEAFQLARGYMGLRSGTCGPRLARGTGDASVEAGDPSSARPSSLREWHDRIAALGHERRFHDVRDVSGLRPAPETFGSAANRR
jgi:hypothetical protein